MSVPLLNAKAAPEGAALWLQTVQDQDRRHKTGLPSGRYQRPLTGTPEFILMGWLEKECVNEGNEEMIEREIMSKVPRLLEKGRYFPNGDHGLQPLITFDNMCRFMTWLHDVTGNPDSAFPRV